MFQLQLPGPRTLLYPLIRQRVADEAQPIFDRLQAWRMMTSGPGLDTTDFHGKPVRYSGIEFEGSPRVVFWSGFFGPFLAEAARQSLEWTINYCQRQQLAPDDYVTETRGLLHLLAERVYNHMARTDQALRGKGFPGSVTPVNVSPRIDATKRHIDDLAVALTHRGTSIPALAAEREGVPLAKPPEYDVALSFAGEDRPYVEMAAEQLRSRGVSVFYDLDQEAHLWGKNLYEYLSDLYQHRARFVLMFVSRHYAEKRWPNHERKAAQARALSEAGEYILPAGFDDTDVPGLLPTVSFVDLRRPSPVELAVLVCEKLGRTPFGIKANQVPAPVSPLLAGEARFDYSSHDGRFRIGHGRLEFETRWSKGSSQNNCTR